jgi:uncharacterized protein YcbX
MDKMNYLPQAIRSWFETNYGAQIERISKLDLSTAGGLYLYGISFLMLFVPIAILGFESISKRWQEKMEEKPPLPPPTRISQIRIYPIKSCRGIIVKKAKLLRTGLELDRNWMFVDAKTLKFLTIRENSNMTLINTSFTDDNQLSVDATAIEADAHFKIDAYPSQKWLDANTKLVDVEIWGKWHDAWQYPAEMTAPFEKIFNRKVFLVMKGPRPRILSANGAPKHLGRKEKTMFPDMAPVLVASEKSIADLNARVKAKGEDAPDLTIERFRPNIIVEGTEAWNEDSWKTLQIGDGREKLVLNVLARCARCQVS